MQRDELLRELEPFIVGWIEGSGGGAGPYAPSPHDIGGAHHSGSLGVGQYPDALLRDGTRSLTGNLAVGALVTIDGVDISVLDGDFATHIAATAAAGHTGIGAHDHEDAPGGGQLDHGDALTGLGDDDHTQYLTTGRHSAIGDSAPHHAAATEGDGIAIAGQQVAVALATVSGLEFSSGDLRIDLADAWSGLEFDGNELRVDQDAAFTWEALHIFNAGARIAAGQQLGFSTDVALERGGADQLALATGDAFRSSNFVSGVSGWTIEADGTAEFANVWVRGELHCAVFVKDLIDARAGTLLVAKSAGTLAADMTVPGSGTWTMDVNDPPGGGFLFANSDICRIKTEYVGGVAEIWFTVSGRVDVGGGVQQYTCTYQSGTRSITYPDSAPIVDYGVSGDGFLTMTAELSHAPYYDVATHAGSPWSVVTPHVRLGNLDGVLGLGAEWGLAAGEDLSDNTAAHVIASDTQVGLFGVAQEWWRLDGTKMAELDPSASGTSVLFGAGPDVDSADYRFKILADGSAWLSTLAISEDLGGWLFNLADGLLLLGQPLRIVKEGGSNYWVGTRKERATVTGALHVEQGRWAGSKGLVIAEATTNLCTNPSIEVDITSWSGRGGGSIAQSSSYARFGSYSLQVTPSASVNGGCYFHPNISISASTSYTVTIWFYALNSNVSMRLRVATDVGGNFDTNFVSEAGWQRYTKTFVSNPADTIIEDIRIVKNNDVDTGLFYVDGVQVEQKGYATSYCDGSLGDGYTWSGTAHGSMSTRAATEVNLAAHVGLISGNNTMSFRVIAQAPYDWDADWPVVYNAMFDVRGASDSDRIQVRYRADIDEISVYINGGNRISGEFQFSAGDWLDVVLTIDFSSDSYVVYVNGTAIGSSTTSLSASTLTQWNLGATFNGLNIGNFTFSESAVFDRVLTADEVAALYASQRALADGGAIERPGVYILDGEFRLLSSQTGQRVEITPPGVGIYDDTGLTGVARLLGGRVDTTGAVLDEEGDSLGWFGYDGSDVLQVAWYAEGSEAGKISAGGDKVFLDSAGVHAVVTSSPYVSATGYKFEDGSGTALSELNAYISTTNYGRWYVRPIASTNSYLHLLSECPSGEEASLVMGIKRGVDTASLELFYPDTGDPYMTAYIADVRTTGDLRVGAGLYVGSTGTDPAADEITADGAVKRSGWIMCRAEPGQTALDGTLTEITWGNEVRKDTGYYTHSTVTNEDNITVTQGGWYRVSYCILLDADLADRQSVRVGVYDDGALIPGSRSQTYLRFNTYGRYGACMNSFICELAASSVVDLRTDGFGGDGNFGDNDADYDILSGSQVTIELVS